jgi:hypothetical protein
MWSAVETMTGNPINKNLVHDSVSISNGCAPQFFGEAKTIEKLLKQRHITS